MTGAESDRARRFRADVEQETALLERFTRRRPRLDLRSTRRVLVIGMGSSRFAALPAVARWRRLGIDAYVARASVVADLPPASDLTVVGISSSGRTVETLELLERYRGKSRTILVTNNVSAGASADEIVDLAAGTEAGGVACLTYLATLVTLLDPSDKEIEHAAIASNAVLNGDWLDEALDLLRPADALYMIAPAERMSSAEQSALVLREGPRRRADACEAGDWLHVDLYLSRPGGYRAVLFGGSRFDRDVMRWLLEREATVIAVGREVEGVTLQLRYPYEDQDMVATLIETSVMERIAAEWWIRDQT